MSSKTVLITGVSGGIGSAMAAAFGDAGWAVAGADVTGKGEHCGLFFEVDVSKADEVRSLSGKVGEAYGRLDCIVNNAAILVEKTLFDTTEEEWDKVVATNLGSVYYTTRYLINLLGSGSSIINVSSVHARATSAGLAAYAATKGAVSALTRAMALEMAGKGIRVNAILPGAIETPMLQQGLKRAPDPGAARKRVIDTTPLGKIGSPGDVAQLALFLADSERASNITGQEFVVDGGALARLSTE